MVWLERAFRMNAQIVGLVLAKFGEFHVQMVQMSGRDFFVKLKINDRLSNCLSLM